jgi:cbb3-type cytochrome oxidase subunit 3
MASVLVKTRKIMKKTTLQQLARIAGGLYLIIVILGFWGIMYVPSQIKVKNNPAATFHNVVQHEWLFRSGTASQLTSSVVFICLVLVLYRVFRNVHEHRAKLMVALVLVQIPVVFLAEAFNMAALMTAKGHLMPSLALPQRQDFVYFLIRTYNYSLIALMIFWGLWLIPFGQLVLKSGYLPRIIGILLIAGGWAYVVESLDFILLNEQLAPLTDYTFVLYSAAELSTVVWLLAKGIRTE